MRATIKQLAARILCAAGVPAIARWRSSSRLAILMYHGIEGEPLCPPCDYVLDAATLRRQLEYVRRHFNVLSLEDALERLRDGTLPRRAVALTFDDGTRNLLTHAAPVLRDLGLSAAVFLATGPMGSGRALWPDRIWLAIASTELSEIDLTMLGLGTCSLRSPTDRNSIRDAAVQRLKRLPDAERLMQVDRLVSALGPEPDAYGGPFQMLSWDEARALASDGRVALYPHTVTHPILSTCSDEKIEYEITESCSALEREIGRAPAVFAYPNGGEQDFDERAKAALHRNGVGWALSTIHGFADRDSDPLALPRIGIGDNPSMALFRLKVSGFKAPRRRPRASGASPRAGIEARDEIRIASR